MKHIIIAFIASLLPYIGAGLWYWNFNMRYWTPDARLFVFIFGVFLGILEYLLSRLLFDED